MIVTGDFNSKPSEDPIRILVNENDSMHLVDSRNISELPHYGPGGTFNGFQSKENSEEPIDFIFIRNGIRVIMHATLSQTWKGRFSSDHFPVFARLILPGKFKK